MDPGPVLRTVRAAVFAVVCVTLSVAGHEWMSGHTVARWGLLTAAGAVFVGAYALGGRRRGFLPIAGLMLAGQAVLHELFTFAQGSAAADGWVRFAGRVDAVIGGLVHPHPAPDAAWAQMPMPPGMSMPMSMPGMPAMDSGGGAASSTAMLMTGHAMWGMLAAHALAGLVCSWWLARGEARVFGLLLALVMAVFVPQRLALAACPVSAAPRPAIPIGAKDQRTRYKPLLIHSVVRRGPPGYLPSI